MRQPGEKCGGVHRGAGVHGRRLLGGGKLGVGPKSLERAEAGPLREITRRNRGISLDRIIRELNSFLTGWVTYFRHAACKSHLTELDGWIRRKLHCVRLKQCNRCPARSGSDPEPRMITAGFLPRLDLGLLVVGRVVVRRGGRELGRAGVEVL